MRAEVVPFARAVTGIEGTARGSLDGTGAYVFAGSDAFLATPCPAEANGWCVNPVEATTAEAAPDGEVAPLPDGLVAETADGWRAWFAGPTDEYAHGILGDAIEARSIAIENGRVAGAADGATRFASPLPPGDVFEDLTPRLADMNGDGTTELVAIASDRRGGASLAVFGLRLTRSSFGLVPVARTPSIGTPNRWLNPAAIHDFDRDGVADVALVETPHIGGELQLWSGASLLAGEPKMLAARRGFSNHAIGSRALDLAEVVRADGTDMLVLPDAERDALVAVAYDGREWRETGRVDLPGRVGANIASVGRDLIVALESGQLVRITLE